MEGELTDVGTSDVVETVPEDTRDTLAVGELELGDARSDLGVSPHTGSIGRPLTIPGLSCHRVGAVARNFTQLYCPT
jgi:hypothetical protein